MSALDIDRRPRPGILDPRSVRPATHRNRTHRGRRADLLLGPAPAPPVQGGKVWQTGDTEWGASCKRCGFWEPEFPSQEEAARWLRTHVYGSIACEFWRAKTRASILPAEADRRARADMLLDLIDYRAASAAGLEKP